MVAGIPAFGEDPVLQVVQSRHYNAYISMPRGYVSGLLLLRCEDQTVKGSLFNEFGITALDFTYDRNKDKVKLHSVMKMMDRWYIRRVLRRDLREMMKRLEQGDSIYDNNKRHIHYKFTPMLPAPL